MNRTQKKATILVIDDTPANLVVIVRYLEAAAYRVVVAQDAEEGIQRADYVRPDLILMDVLMPGMNGFEACKKLKANEKTRNIPILFMTALSETNDKITAYKVGGVDYITKPFQSEELIARVNTHLTLHAMQQLLETRNRQLQKKMDQQHRYQNDLKHQASHDTLTGLPNRTLFNDRLSHAVSKAERNQSSLAVLFIDLDKFKLINDTLGHSVGDDLLRSMAKRLEDCVRKSDTLARLGGDEFVVLVENLQDETVLAQLIQRFAATLEQAFLLSGEEYTLSCSIGVCIYPQDGEDAETLLKHADIAMYHAKDAGRNTHCFFTSEMQALLQQRTSMEQSLHMALKHEEFVLLYQPQIDLATGQVCGVEALIRWHAPDGRILPPSLFIPIAEESRIILEIGEWVLEKVCQQIRSWRDDGLDVVPVAINLAAQQFLHHSLDQLVRHALEKYDIPGSDLELEVTETMSMREPEFAIEMMSKLKKIGVSLAIDDFGIGYSNLSYLKRFHVDKLKIDMSYVQGITSNSADRAIVEAIIHLAHALGLRAIAEGVETDGQCQILSDKGCDMSQGYYFRPPVSAPEITVLLRQKSRFEPHQKSASKHERYVLFVGAEAGEIKAIADIRQFTLLTAKNSQQACEMLAQQQVDVVIQDISQPIASEIDFLTRIKTLYPHTTRILMTKDVQHISIEYAVNQAEIFKLITQPCSSEQIINILQAAFRLHE